MEEWKIYEKVAEKLSFSAERLHSCSPLPWKWHFSFIPLSFFFLWGTWAHESCCSSEPETGLGFPQAGEEREIKREWQRSGENSVCRRFGIWRNRKRKRNDGSLEKMCTQRAYNSSGPTGNCAHRHKRADSKCGPPSQGRTQGYRLAVTIAGSAVSTGYRWFVSLPLQRRP